MSNNVRFIHGADLHLGAPFGGLNARENSELKDTLYKATCDAWDRLVAHAIAEHVDFVVLAGDIFDSTEPDQYCKQRFRTGLQTLCDNNINVYMSHGNHDARIGRMLHLHLPENVHVFSAESVERVDYADGHRSCAIYGRSFHKRAVDDNYSLGFIRDPHDVNAIGILHANVGGSEQYENYAPCSLDDLVKADMDYWALGHIHNTDGPLSVDPYIVYSGSTQALSTRERSRHGCYSVELTEGRISKFQWLETGIVNYAHCDVDVSGCESPEALLTVATEASRACYGQAAGTLVVRLILRGKVGFSSSEFRTYVEEDLVGDVSHNLRRAHPNLWIDTTVKDQTKPAIDLDSILQSSPYLRCLQSAANEMSLDAAYADIALNLKKLRKSAPEVEALIDFDQLFVAAQTDAVERLISQGDVS